MSRPSSFCSICTSNCAFELTGLLLSLSVHHPDEKMFIVSDTPTQTIVNKMTPKPRLKITWFVELDEYDGMDRAIMTQKGVFSEFLMAKARVIKYALQNSPDTAFLDSDIILTDCIDDIDMTKEMGVSPQFISQEHIDKTGYYNAGFLWTKNKDLPNDWIKFTQSSRYFEQASIEDLAKKYSYFEFGENYNLQCWRFYLSDEPPQQIAGNISSANNKLLYKNKPLKFVHTHFLDGRFKQFNDLIIHHFVKARMYKTLAIVYRVIHDKWVLKIPLQPMKGLGRHNNDSYRELPVLMKFQNSDVDIKFCDKTIHCWLEPNILTYDRPTLEWCNEEIVTSSLVLLGNGDVNVEGRQLKSMIPGLNVKPWIFWPRKPMLLEKILKTNGILSYHDRNVQSIFIGNFENGVQERFRKTDAPSWESALTEYHCARGSKHKFTHEEYLMKIRDSRYGLCLRGYGSKCHREVELMAFGTVPIVTPEVCISSFMEPPNENIHYISVKSPEELKTKLANIDPDQWAQMSSACYEWYQRNIHSKNCWENMIQNLLYDF